MELEYICKIQSKLQDANLKNVLKCHNFESQLIHTAQFQSMTASEKSTDRPGFEPRTVESLDCIQSTELTSYMGKNADFIIIGLCSVILNKQIFGKNQNLLRW